MLDVLSLPFVQRGALEVLLLAVAAGTVGVWVVLRGLAFYAHAVGTAAFPGLVLADGLGFSAHLGAGATAALVAVAVTLLGRDRRDQDDATTALVLVAALVAGIVLASDVFASGASVDTLLFGSLLTIDTADVVWAGAAAVVTLLAAAVLGRRWTAAGFDPAAARATGAGATWMEGVLLALVALVAVVALSAVGALLAAAFVVVPAATARLLVDRLRPWRVATVVVAALEGVGGLWLSVELNAPPGATIAVVAAVVFVLVALLRHRAGRALLATGAAAAVVAGCGGATGTEDGKVRVVATTTQLADVARAVGGDRVVVHQLLQPNTDPHEYEPRPADVTETARAAVVLESGDGLDAWMRDVVRQGGGDAAVVDVGARVPTRLPGEEEDEAGHEHGAVDPHWWHDPRNVAAAAEVVAGAIAKADPAAKADVEAGARAYAGRVRALDRRIAGCMRAVPATERKLVTDHDAFGYFTARYGVTVVGAVIPSQTTRAQTSARDVARLTDLIRREDVKAVFPESSVNAKVAKAIAAQTGATSRYELYGDTLGPKRSAGATYLGMEAHNADAMVRGFTGGARGCPS